MDINTIVAWLNDTAVKSVLIFLGALALKRWEPFVNKAIPTVIALGSALISTLQVMFPGLPPATAPAMFSAGSFLGIDYYMAANPVARGASWLWNTAVPVAFAIAAQSGAKNTREWASIGMKLFWPGGKPVRKVQ